MPNHTPILFSQVPSSSSLLPKPQLHHALPLPTVPYVPWQLKLLLVCILYENRSMDSRPIANGGKCFIYERKRLLCGFNSNTFILHMLERNKWIFRFKRAINQSIKETTLPSWYRHFVYLNVELLRLFEYHSVALIERERFGFLPKNWVRIYSECPCLRGPDSFMGQLDPESV